MSGIFGGAPKQNPNQTVTQNPPDYAIPKLTEISNLAKAAYDKFIASGYNMPFAGQRSAGQNPMDTRAMDVARAGADSFLTSGAPQMSLDLSKFYSDKIFGGAYDPTKAIEAYARPITQNFTESIAPRLTSAAIDAGAYGGSKSSEFNNRAVRDLNTVLADTASRVALSYDQAEKGAAGLVPQLANTSLQQSGAAADVYGNIGNTQRGFAQQTINDDIARWNEQTQSPFAGLGEYLQLVSGSAPGKSQTTYGYQQPGSSFLSGLAGLSSGIGLAGSALGALGVPAATTLAMNAGLPAGIVQALSFLSDKRVKENIVFSHMEKGFKVYYFNYIWDKTRMFLGVLAQEVMKKKPEAVMKVGNLFAVDYSMLGFEMEEVV